MANDPVLMRKSDPPIYSMDEWFNGKSIPFWIMSNVRNLTTSFRIFQTHGKGAKVLQKTIFEISLPVFEAL